MQGNKIEKYHAHTFKRFSFKYISYQSRIIIIKNIPFNTHIEIHMIRAIYDIPYWLAMGPRRGWSYFIFVNWCCHEENYFYYYYYFYFYIIFLAGTFQRALRSVLILVQELRAVAFVRLFFCFPHVEFCVVRFCICTWSFGLLLVWSLIDWDLVRFLLNTILKSQPMNYVLNILPQNRPIWDQIIGFIKDHWWPSFVPICSISLGSLFQCICQLNFLYFSNLNLIIFALESVFVMAIFALWEGYLNLIEMDNCDPRVF